MNKKYTISLIIVLCLSGMITAYTKVSGVTTFSGNIEGEYGTTVSGATVVLADSGFNIMDTDITDSNGDYTLSTSTSSATYYITVTPNHRWDSDMKIVFSSGTYNFELDAVTEKIAVFFWASDACNNDSIIDGYADLLEDNENYKKIFKFKDSSNVASDCTTVDNWERPCDTVFVYVWTWIK